jgi:hypothetical protein
MQRIEHFGRAFRLRLPVFAAVDRGKDRAAFACYPAVLFIDEPHCYKQL